MNYFLRFDSKSRSFILGDFKAFFFQIRMQLQNLGKRPNLNSRGMIRSGKECIWQVGMKTLEIEKCPRVVGRGSRRFLVQVGESKEKPWINKRCVCPGLRRFFRLESKQWRSTCDCTHKGRNDWNSNHEIAQLLLQPPFFQLLRVS